MSNKRIKIEELKFLRDKCLLFNKYMIETGSFPSGLLEAYEESKRLIEKAFLDGNLKSLQTMSRDIDNQVLKPMPTAMALKLKKIFKEKLGIEYVLVDKDYSNQIQKILKRGKILDDKEYELLLNRADEIHQDSEKSEELSQINILLSVY